jgi:peptide deformylase
MKIIQYPDPRLLQVCKEVTDFEAGRKVAQDLFKALQDSERSGVGLAAPQIGSDLRVFVMHMVMLEITGSSIFINPLITHWGSQTAIANEGCLSWEGGVPNVAVKRSLKITVKAFDGDGKPFKMKLEGLAARCAQHEIDHLNGYNLADRMGSVAKEDKLLRYVFAEQNR